MSRRYIIKRNKTNFFECPICKSQIKKEVNIDEYTTNKELIRLIDSSFQLNQIYVNICK